jgi:hypothetical protein
MAITAVHGARSIAGGDMNAGKPAATGGITAVGRNATTAITRIHDIRPCGRNPEACVRSSDTEVAIRSERDVIEAGLN